MERTPHVLVLSDDPRLLDEFSAALPGGRGAQVVPLRMHGLRAGVEAARDRRPDVIVLELDRDLQALRALADAELLGPGGPLVLATYTPGTLDESGEPSRFIDAMRAGVTDFLRRPLSSVELREVLQRHGGPRVAPRTRPGRVVAFVSNKGGVGKSTLAVNVACALARRHPERVLLLDASLQLGVCASMLDLEPESTLADAAAGRERIDETFLRQLAVPHECGLRLLAAPLDAVEAARVDEAAIARVLSVARRAFDYVIVDTFPVLDSVAMTILDLSDVTCVLVNGAVPNVLGVSRLFPVLDRVGCPASRQRIIFNETHPRYSGRLEPADVAERLGRDLYEVFPFDRRLLAAQNVGEPLALRAGSRFGFGRALRRLVEALEGEAAASSRSGAERPAVSTGVDS